MLEKKFVFKISLLSVKLLRVQGITRVKLLNTVFSCCNSQYFFLQTLRIWENGTCWEKNVSSAQAQKLQKSRIWVYLKVQEHKGIPQLSLDIVSFLKHNKGQQKNVCIF